MLADLFGVVILACAGLGLLNWRHGMLLFILIGALQDPLRKLTPGAPALFVFSALPVWLAVCLAMFGQVRKPLRDVREDHPLLERAIKLFVLTLVPATLLVFRYGFGAWKIAMVGLFGYINPIMAFLVGYYYVRNSRDLERLMRFYCVVTSVMMIGTLAQHLGLWAGWRAIGTEALHMQWIRYRQDYIVNLVSGFYRSPDIMGWHAATLVMFALILAQRRGWRVDVPMLSLATWGAVCLLLCGRRKSIMMPVIWIAMAGLAHVKTGGVGRLLKLSVLVLGIVGGVIFASKEVAIDEEYFKYAGTHPGEISERMQQQSWKAVVETYRQSGFFGKGLGVASQGIQHLGVGVRQSWQEGGIPRFMVELGVMGLLAGIGLGFMMARECFKAVIACPQGSPGQPFVLGLAGLLAANGCSFLASHQVFNDLVIMVLTSFCLGAAVSGPTWCGDGPDAEEGEDDAI